MQTNVGRMEFFMVIKCFEDQPGGCCENVVYYTAMDSRLNQVQAVWYNYQVCHCKYGQIMGEGPFTQQDLLDTIIEAESLEDYL